MAYIDTENIPLHMPVPGTREPAQIALLNENCVALSLHDHTDGKALAIGRLRSGLEANRPAAGSAGNVYFSTDTGRFWADTGTAWVGFITEGGQATVTGWTLIDPVIRDTLQFGPEGSATIDNNITRTGANALRTDSRLGVGTAPGVWAASLSAIHVGATGSVVGHSSGIQLSLAANTVFNTNSTAIVAGAASQVQLLNGEVVFSTAPSVAAGAQQTFTNRLVMSEPGVVGLGATPLVWATVRKALQIGQGGSLSSNTTNPSVFLRSNVVFSDSDRAIITGHCQSLQLDSPDAALRYYNSVNKAAGAPAELVERLSINGNGTVTSIVVTGQPNLIVPAGNLELVAPDGVWLHTQGMTANMAFQMNRFWGAGPGVDNQYGLGYTNARFVVVYAVAGSINTSHVSMKENITALDPAACVGAVLGTEWWDFDYKPPVPPERQEGQTDEEWASQEDGYNAMVEETAPNRHSRGYILGSGDHQTSDLFGLADRKSGQATSDLAVVACALQDALKRIAALEANGGVSGQAPAA